MTDATVKVNFNDGSESDEGIEVTVYVYDPYFTLNITLDDAVAEKAASISVYAEGKEDSETTAALFQTVDAVYTAGEKTAKVKLAKDKANKSKWFNNIEVTVKDSDGNKINVECNPVYFCYTADDFTGLTVSSAVAQKTFTINFDGFTIVGGSVTGLKYSTKWFNSSAEWEEETTVTPDVVVSADGKSATFDVSQTKEFYIDWTAVTVKDSEENTILISSGNKEGNKWYGYSEDVWSNTLTHVSGEYTNLCEAKAFTASDSYVQVIDASEFNALSISTLKVVVKLTSATEGKYWASASSASSYVADTYQSLAWSDDEGGYSEVITSETFIAALKTNGLYLDVDSSAVGTVTVDYIAK